MKALIAGSGVMGLWTAYYLKQTGYEVTILEKDRGPSGSSMGNAGMVVPSHFVPLSAPGVIGQSLKWLIRQDSPLSIRPRFSKDLLHWGLKFLASSRKDIQDKRELLFQLNYDSGMLYQEIIKKEGFRVGYKPKGLAMYCKSEKALEEEASLIPVSESLGQEARLLSRKEAQTLDPGLELDIAGAVYYPGDAFMAPHDLMIQLKEYLLKEGVTILNQSPLQKIRVAGNRVEAFESNGKEYLADEYIITTGAWSNQWKRELKLNIPLQAGKGYSFTVDKPVGLPEICSILVEARIAVTPMHHSLRFAGTMEIVGLDPRINQTKVNGIKKAIPSYFPAFELNDFEGLDIWYGFRPVSPDGLPYIGRPNHLSNLTIATGHAMMGFSLGPVTGKMVREILVEGKGNHPLLNPGRFG